MLKVKELKNTKLPASFVDLFPCTCESCGADNEVPESLTFVRCSNVKCKGAAVYRLFYMLQDLGVLGMTLEKCKEFMDRFKTNNPYLIFLFNPKKDGLLYEGCSEVFAQKVYTQISKRRGMLLWEFIKLGHYPCLSGNAEKIFEGYTNLESFYKDLKEGGMQFIQQLLLKDTDYEDTDALYVQAVTVYDTLMQFKSDIEIGYRGVVILKPKMVLNYVFLDNLNADVLKSLRIEYKDSIYFNNQTYLHDTTDVLIVPKSFRKDTSLICKAKELEIPVVIKEDLSAFITKWLTYRGV